jgi:hypothetical protein
MGQFAWKEQVDSLNAILDPLDAKGANSDPSTAELEELKSSLDELRLRAWSLLMATNSDDPHGLQERFRTRRGTEMCRALVTDLETGKLSNRPSELPGLGTAARDLAATVKKVTQKAPKGSGERQATKPRGKKARRGSE